MSRVPLLSLFDLVLDFCPVFSGLSISKIPSVRKRKHITWSHLFGLLVLIYLHIVSDDSVAVDLLTDDEIKKQVSLKKEQKNAETFCVLTVGSSGLRLNPVVEM